MDLTKRYYDHRNTFGKVDIFHMVKFEPEWAANRIQVGERALAMLSEDQRRAAESVESQPATDEAQSREHSNVQQLQVAITTVLSYAEEHGYSSVLESPLNYLLDKVSSKTNQQKNPTGSEFIAPKCSKCKGSGIIDIAPYTGHKTWCGACGGSGRDGILSNWMR